MNRPANKIIKVIFSAVFLSLCVWHLSFASSNNLLPQAKVRLSKKTITVGEEFRYRIIISCPVSYEIELPVFGQAIGDFTIKDSRLKTSRFFNRKKVILELRLETFETGKTLIPKSLVKYRAKPDESWKELEIAETPIEVISLLEKSGSKDNAVIKDIKGPLNPHRRLNTLILIVIVSLAVIAAIIFMAGFKKKIHAAPIPRRPAHEIALEQLEYLKTSGLICAGKIKEYYTQISYIIRYYLENRFNLRAPEMTTEEFLIHVRDNSELANAHKALLKEFLLACDLVKFAKHVPLEQEMEAIFDSAKNFVEQTKEEPRVKEK